MKIKSRQTGGLVISAVAGVLFLAGCGGSTAPAIVQQPAPSTPAVVVSISPETASVVVGASQQFTATVQNDSANKGVSWSVSGSGCVGLSCGSIDSTGMYTAPVGVPNPPTVTVAAISRADASKSASATVTVEGNSNDSKLSGQYAFLFSGFSSEGRIAVVGSFTADGNGNMVGGNADVTFGQGVSTNQGLTASKYSVGPDNRGSMTLYTAVNFPTDDFSFAFSFVLDSFSPAGVAGGGRLIGSGNTDETGTGFFVRQDATAFSTGAMTGGYAFGLAAPEGIYEFVAFGRFTAAGGSLSAGHIDLVPGNTGRVVQDQPFTGTYSVDGSGRGEATLNISGQSNPSNFILYVVSSVESLWMDAGGGGATGMALQQSGGPFTLSSLNGTSVFGAAGFTVAGNDAVVGEVQFDGKGNLSGTDDENYFGLWFADEPISGTYTVDSNGLGRGVISEDRGPGLSVFYLVSPGRGFIISGNDSLEFGSFEPQTGAPFSNASLSGNYALGTLPLLTSSPSGFVAGVLMADGTGNLSGESATKAGGQSFKGTYSVAANGRATLAITSASGVMSNWVFYLASLSKAVGMQGDAGAADSAVNVIEK